MTSSQISVPLDQKVNKKMAFYIFLISIFVTLSHSTAFLYTTNKGSDSLLIGWLTNLYTALGNAGITMLFMFSGYLFYFGVRRRSDLGGKMVRRLVALGIPFLFWNVIYFIYRVAYVFYKDVKMTVTEIVLGFTFDPFDSPLWYILALLILVCLSELIYYLDKNVWIARIACAAIFVGCLVFCSLSESESFAVSWLERIACYLPAYMIGAYMGMHSVDVVVEEKYKSKKLSVISAVIAALIIVYFIFLRTKLDAIDWVLYQCLPILVWIAVPADKFGIEPLKFPFTVSFFVYAMHSLCLIVLNWFVIRIVLGNTDLPAIVDAILNLLIVGVVYLICLGVAFLAKKLLPKWIYYIIAGGRSGRKMI